MKYSEKLKDPRCQKKRLEILQRDEWTCQKCYDSESTLNVHHRRYLPEKDPWDYPNEILITLCSTCHDHERESLPEYEKMLLCSLKEKFMADDIYSIFSGFYDLELVHTPEVVASMIEWFLKDKNLQREMMDRFFKHLASRRKPKNKGK